jgi:hypothetical protein
MRRRIQLLYLDGVKREAKVLAGGHEGQPRKLTDCHTLEDLIVDREFASTFRFFHSMGPESPTVEVGRCVEYLGQSCSLFLSDPHD